MVEIFYSLNVIDLKRFGMKNKYIDESVTTGTFTKK